MLKTTARARTCILACALIAFALGANSSICAAQQSVNPAVPSTGAPPNNTSNTIREKESNSTTQKDSSSIREKEREAKEIKEIKDQPSDLVGVSQAIAWPASILIISALILFTGAGRRMLGVFPKVIRKINFGVVGVEMEISQEAADEVRNYLRGSFKELIERADEEYRRLAAAFRVYDMLQAVVEHALVSALKQHSVSRPPNVRGTAYVPDIVFLRCLYQVVDYYPQSRANGPAGRRFSQRFGIIGRGWRLEESMGRGNTIQDTRSSQRELIELWGMTREEASSASRARPSDLSIILRSPEDGNLPVGLLFLDTTESDGFGNNEVAGKVAKALEASEEVKELAIALGRMMSPLRLAGPQLDITRSF